MFDELYKVAIRNGIKSYEFWDMSYGEIIDTIQAYNDNKIEEMKLNAFISYNNACLVAKGVSNAFGGGTFPAIHEAFPTLFEAPKLVQQDSELMKARIMEYAKALKKYKNRG